VTLEINPPGEFAPRLEDERFLTGRGRYVDDDVDAGAVFAVVVRSEHAHARIVSVDTANALEAPGVVGIHTEAELSADNLGPMPCGAALDSLVTPPRYALARDIVRHVGDPIALVIARTRNEAQAAAELVVVDYDPLPAVVGKREALADGAPQIWPQASGNVAFRMEKGDRDALESVLTGAAHVVTATLDNTRVSALPMEPRAGAARFDAETGTFILRCNGQGLHSIRKQLAVDVFGLPESDFHLFADDVGGGFGLKNFLYPEWILLCWAARHHHVPVHWVADRGEELSSAAHGRDMLATARLALDNDGRFLALDVDALVDMGAYLSGSGPNIATRSFPTAMGGIYQIPIMAMQATGVFTNTGTVDAYRGAGKPEANYIIERMIDIAAAQLGMDAVALRQRNAIAQTPYTSAFGTQVDCGRFAANIEDAVRYADRDGFEERRASALAKGQWLGQGLACFLETARGTPSEGAEIAFMADGSVEMRVGTESHGQGHETAFTQVVTHRLGIPASAIRFVQADTMRTRMGFGHGGARSMHMGGHTLWMAMDTALEKGTRVAAQLLQCEPSDIAFANGIFSAGDGSVGDGSGRQVTLLDAARSARETPEDFGLDAAGLDSFERRDDAPLTLPNGCHVVEALVDPDTGAVSLTRYVAVDDYGTLINPPLAEAQVLGGVVQGIGQALGEVIVYEQGSGQLLSGSLMDYYIPRADVVPPTRIYLEGVPTKNNALGVKGTGQAGAIVSTQAVINAVMDAVRPHGVSELDMPVTPERVWRAVQAAKAS
jgi:carbon-monoxide dehydrogenase large subunit